MPMLTSSICCLWRSKSQSFRSPYRQKGEMYFAQLAQNMPPILWPLSIHSIHISYVIPHMGFHSIGVWKCTNWAGDHKKSLAHLTYPATKVSKASMSHQLEFTILWSCHGRTHTFEPNIQWHGHSSSPFILITGWQQIYQLLHDLCRRHELRLAVLFLDASYSVSQADAAGSSLFLLRGMGNWQLRIRQPWIWWSNWLTGS